MQDLQADNSLNTA